ncbi:DUF2683 family protein [Pseudopedobacter sp.]|uniref:DUF2683 family protein n=1 Tax=Pseudopedobacter sp. TaxID=1936787 RepID=UPI0033415194
MATLTIQVPDNEKEFIIKLLKKVNVKVISSDKSSYDPDFVTEVKKSIAERKAGKKGLKVDVNNLWK